MPDATCTTCAANGRRGYCARGRCYCGHATCHAFDSWVDIRSAGRPAATPANAPRGKSAWDQRDESTWIDRL